MTAHGRLSTYRRHHCRCDACRDAARAAWRAFRARKAAGPGLPPGDSRHGTLNGYTNWLCRCDTCRDAWSGYLRGLRGRTVAP